MPDSKLILNFKPRVIIVSVALVCVIIAGIFGGLKYKQYKLINNIEQNYKTFNEITYLYNGNNWSDDPLAKTCVDTLGFQIFGYNKMVEELDKISDISEVDKTIDRYSTCIYFFDEERSGKLNNQNNIIDNINAQIAYIKDLESKEKAEKLLLLFKEIRNKNNDIQSTDFRAREQVSFYLTSGVKKYYHKEISLKERDAEISQMDSIYKEGYNKTKKLKEEVTILESEANDVYIRLIALLKR